MNVQEVDILRTTCDSTDNSGNCHEDNKSYDSIENLDSSSSSWNIITESCRKLDNVFKSLSSFIPSPSSRIHRKPCTSTEDATNYRCKCTFQIVLVDAAYTLDSAVHDTTTKEDTVKCTAILNCPTKKVAVDYKFRYAIRESDRGPIPIMDDIYPIPCLRIQTVMSGLLQYLNDSMCSYNLHETRKNDQCCISCNLTSVTFVSSWIGILAPSTNKLVDEADCIVTLHYDSSIEDVTQWKTDAQTICTILKVNQIIGRSRKRIVEVNSSNNHSFDPTSSALSTCDDYGENVSYLRDTVWLTPTLSTSGFSSYDNNNGNHHYNLINQQPSYLFWDVGFIPKGITAYYSEKERENEHEEIVVGSDNSGNDREVGRQPTSSIPVLYTKSIHAFFHPNPKVMCQALSWILNRISLSRSTSFQHKHNLVEVYCGCGAHTVAIAQTGLVQHIIAVEYDIRLVQAMEQNCTINKIPYKRLTTATTKSYHSHMKNCNEPIVAPDPICDTSSTSSTTTIDIVCADAGKWAREKMMSSSSKQGESSTHEQKRKQYNLLLVDPPRHGLSQEVMDWIHSTTCCKDYFMNDNGTDQMYNFDTILYVSCGKDALIHDIQKLAANYEVVDCLILDLFPGTTSVETLIHFQRRRKNE